MVIPRPHRSSERSPGPLWAWPALAAAIGSTTAAWLASMGAAGRDWLDVIWSGDIDAATTLLQVVATADMTALTLTFSVTVVALQLASQQFSPRLLREFARDPVTKAVMAVLVGTLLFALVTLARLSADEPVPIAAVVVTLLLGVASIASILVFIAHMLRFVRVDTMMLVVHDDTARAIDRSYPPHEQAVERGDELESALGRGSPVTADRSGFVERVEVAHLLRVAVDLECVIRVEVRAGDHVVSGTPIATAWGRDGRVPSDRAADGVRRGIGLAYERTLEQDTGFGFRQLEDIAVKAMSPSVNDPVTAAHAVGHMADLLVRLVGRRLGPTLHVDGHGEGRVIVPDRDLRYYLDLACAQLRRFGAAEPTVLVALLRMLRDVAVACRDDHQRQEVRRAAGLVAAAAASGLAEVDAGEVATMLTKVEAALRGDTREAYTDRAGETRSL